MKAGTVVTFKLSGTLRQPTTSGASYHQFVGSYGPKTSRSGRRRKETLSWHIKPRRCWVRVEFGSGEVRFGRVVQGS
jgi:hypothetical protein